MAGCGCCEGAKRMVTTREVGRNWSAPILNCGVNCSEAISNEKVSCAAVCMPPGAACGEAACCIPPVAAGCGETPVIGEAGPVRIVGAGVVGVGIGMMAGVIGCGAGGSTETTG